MPTVEGEIVTPIPPMNPLAILEKAISSGMDPDKLGKLMDLTREWKIDRAREAFSNDMNMCQKEMPIVLMDAENTHTHKRYATLESVNRVCKPCYTEHGFSIQFAEGEARNPDEVRIVADVLHAGGHERRYFIDLPRDGRGAKGGQSSMNDIQGKGSTFSYGQRYLVKMIFNLTISGEDDDAQGAAAGLTDDQVVTLNELLDDLQELATDIAKYEKWLADFWLYVECKDGLNDLKPSNFNKAKLELERTLRLIKKGGKP